jgi:hypothetical protein
VVILHYLLVALELALHLLHGRLDGGKEIMVAGFAELVEAVAGHVEMGHVLVVLVGDGPAGMELAVEETFDFARLLSEEVLDVGALAWVFLSVNSICMRAS